MFHNQNKKMQGKNPRESTFYSVPVCILIKIYIVRREFPAEMFPLSKKNKSRDLLLLKELRHEIWQNSHSENSHHAE